MRVPVIATLLCLLTTAASAQGAWNFSYGFQEVFAPNADQYLVQVVNAQKHAEGTPGPRFWTPVQAGIPATLRYRFPFPAATSQVHVRAQCSVWNYSLGVGEGSLWASTDGTNWTRLFDNPVPPPGLPNGSGTSLVYDADLPASLLGSQELWLEVRMTRLGGSYPYGGVQFCRRDTSYPPPSEPVFSVEANFGPLASYVPFGVGCPQPGGATPNLYAPAGEAPVIGTSSVLRVDNLPTTVVVPVFIIGFSTTYSTGPGGNYPLPLELSALGWPGCYQLVSLNESVFTITTTGSADHTFTLPNYGFLAGLQFHVQVLVLYDGGDAAVTNAITATAGW